MPVSIFLAKQMLKNKGPIKGRKRRMLAKKAYDVLNEAVQHGTAGDPHTQIFVQSNIPCRTSEQTKVPEPFMTSFALECALLWWICDRNEDHRNKTKGVHPRCTHPRQPKGSEERPSGDSVRAVAWARKCVCTELMQATVDEMKADLFKKSGVPPEEQHLVYVAFRKSDGANTETCAMVAWVVAQGWAELGCGLSGFRATS